MNPILLAALADRIASRLSLDAARWRPDQVRTALNAPIALEFRFAGGSPAYGAGLLEALRLRVAAPYTARDHPGAAAVVAAGPERPADGEVALRAEERDGTPGVAVEVRLRGGPDAPPAWVPLIPA